MTQKDTELLLKDLCARLPYGVKICAAFNGELYDEELQIVNTSAMLGDYGPVPVVNSVEDDINDGVVLTNIKPYLFPLSSMTEEQKYNCPIGVANLETFIKNESWTYLELTPDSILRFVDWLNKNYFDYRGLIEKGLAIDATGLNIY